MFGRGIPSFDLTETAVNALEIAVNNYGYVGQPSKINGRPDDRYPVEMLGVCFILTMWQDREQMMTKRGFSPKFAELDFADRFKNCNPGEAVFYDPTGVLKDYLNAEGKLDYTYGERLFYQWNKIEEELRNNPHSRQAFMSVWDPKRDVDMIGVGRVPCSIGYQFFIRDDKLHMLYTMRSCNVTECLPNDIYTATRTVEHMADRLGLTVGNVQLYAMSMHLFRDVGEDDQVFSRRY